MIAQVQPKAKVQFDRSKLRGRIVEIYGTNKAFAARIGKTEQSVCAKLAGRSSFKQEDIIEWSDALEIQNFEIVPFYFTQKLSKS